ncbi:succinylglutamate desuccinylase/aspartoacylase family protein [Chelativorans sp. AA-79]|uniref:succinylglutamate desuccinylase/aspartoacylase family protein n=1 Tax=Chelativorans sp. AA-79 TaxID=3028735 RepID=UPI0023F83460|nr:succinylglutamate desuccinylase/aspartoacylase family protein [Chelativorans sp. AA-79]WEX10890.1 succinylglutamate desuccinylase/aspartoacylase family protein [Chelativorans sp. AA-79]
MTDITETKPRKSTAFATVDFDREGRQAGHIHIPHSPHTDAWGATRIPIAVVKNGKGPTVLLTGGNHGDEHEGPIVLGELFRELQPEDITGRVIIIPALNLPAVRAAHRTSPVDGLNLNRTYPGDPAGTISQQISAFVCDHLYPIADAFIDLHSGGSSLDILPSAIVEPAADFALLKRNIEAVLAFDAPLTVVISNLGEQRTSTAASVSAGLTTVGTEMAGAGAVSLEALSIARRGVRNVLSHLGVLPSEPTRKSSAEREVLEIPGKDGYVFAPEAGVFEPFHANGTRVKKGDPAGRIHFVENPERAPLQLAYAQDGILYGRRHPGRVEPGNCCLVVAAPYQGDLL